MNRIAEAARVNIRVGLKNFGPLMKTVIDWVPSAGGFQQEHWDGMDQSAVLDLIQHPKLHIVVDAFTLDANTILVGSSPDTIQYTPGLDSGAMRSVSDADSAINHMHFHSQQPMEKRGDVALNLDIAAQVPGEGAGRLPAGHVLDIPVHS